MPGLNMGIRVMFAIVAAVSAVAGPEAVAKLMAVAELMVSAARAKAEIELMWQVHCCKKAVAELMVVAARVKVVDAGVVAAALRTVKGLLAGAASAQFCECTWPEALRKAVFKSELQAYGHFVRKGKGYIAVPACGGSLAEARNGACGAACARWASVNCIPGSDGAQPLRGTAIAGSVCVELYSLQWGLYRLLMGSDGVQPLWASRPICNKTYIS
eukprot:1158061-Pelagomonas_calceolata.AAC.1